MSAPAQDPALVSAPVKDLALVSAPEKEPSQNVAIIGAGWAGLAAAVRATQAGHRVTVFEAARTVGGRARAVPGHLPDGTPVPLDNGQHILIGAYLETLALMRTVGVDVHKVLLRTPLALLHPNGQGLQLSNAPSPLDALAGIWMARGWSLVDKWSLTRSAVRWQVQGFACPAGTTVLDLCQGMAPAIVQGFIEPLCVSALNTPASRACGQVFLRVLKDSLFGVKGGSNLLLPRADLGQLFPDAACAWLQQHGAVLHTGQRITHIQPDSQNPGRWQVQNQTFDRVLLATSASVATQMLGHSSALMKANEAQAGTELAVEALATQLDNWSQCTSQLQFEAIATVYCWARGVRLAHPMLALHSSQAHPAQFVFDRGQLGGPAGLMAFVVSASQGDKEALQSQVVRQAQAQLGLVLQPMQTIVEKRATFACTPALERPAACIAPGLWACGDYVQGPYPATLEGAVRSGLAVGADL